MASKLFCLIALSTIIAFTFFAYPSYASGVTPNAPFSPATICKYTPNPSYCKSVLPNQTANVYSYGRFSIRKALTQSRRFFNLLDIVLRRRSTLSIAIIRALEDCRLLADLNMDYLSSSFRTVNTTSKILPTMEADDVHSLLSAILTNQQTCLEGLQATASAWSIRNGLSPPLSDDSKLFSVLLALFKKGWVGDKQKGVTWQPTRPQLLFREERLPLKMSDQNRAIYESVSRRKLQNHDDGVLVSDIVIVSKDGSGNYSTITDAVNAAPNNTDVSNSGYFLIYIRAGVYEEYISIAKNKKILMMMGEGINQTIITGNRSVVDGWTTFNSATFGKLMHSVLYKFNTQFPNLFSALVPQNKTYSNEFNYYKYCSCDGTEFCRGGHNYSQHSWSNQTPSSCSSQWGGFVYIYGCSFEGYQDTLYTHSLRQFYRECDIYGTIDFIFGNAAVVLQNCNIYPRLPMSGQFNAITAQGRTDPNQNTGISIHNCTIRAADDLASSNQTVQTYLGGPWKEYSRTVYLQSFMDSLINPAGWHDWSGDFALSTLYYAEYDNRGPGSNTTNRVKWPGYHVISATDAAKFTVSNFLLGNDWLPQTGVPYTGGLI